MHIQGHDYAFFASLHYNELIEEEAEARLENQYKLCSEQAYIDGELYWEFETSEYYTLLDDSVSAVTLLEFPDNLFDMNGTQFQALRTAAYKILDTMVAEGKFE